MLTFVTKYNYIELYKVVLLLLKRVRSVSSVDDYINKAHMSLSLVQMEEILSVLKPITQAVQLLQARKSMADVASTVEMCADLSAVQVCKVRLT